MRSSTSNSDSNMTPSLRAVAPQQAWGRTWTVTVVLTLLALGAWEGFLRARGHRPTVVDDAALWSVQRERVNYHDPNKVLVCLGDCRMELGFVPDLLRNRLPGYRVVSLAVEATSPMASLRDLAEDETFKGIVLCGVTAREFSTDMWDTQQPYIDFYHREYTWNTRLNRQLSGYAQQRLVYLHPFLRADDLLVKWLRSKTLPEPYYLETRFDRSRVADYSNVDLQDHQRFTVDRVANYYLNKGAPDPNAWLTQAMVAEDYVQAIQERGGRVAFIRFPTTGTHYAREQMGYPREEFWDPFAAQTSAYAVFFQDVPELAGFDCPDLSHLDRRDAPKFTLALIDHLEQAGVLPPSPWAPQPTKPKPGRPGGPPADFNPFDDSGDEIPEDFNPFAEDGNEMMESDDFNPFADDAETLPADGNPFD